MEAKTLNCPMCGASAATDATKCLHCGARLATIACPACFGMIFRGAKFCSHCGAKVDRKEVKADVALICPRCRVKTNAIVIGKTDLRECPKCEGLWADADALQQICTDREQQVAVLGVAAPVDTSGAAPLEKIQYRPCPVCHQLMHRVNFARCSHVVVDVCKPHGTWFDKDELRRIVEFIRTGGFDKVRAMEKAELSRQKAELETARAAAAYERAADYRSPLYDSRESALALAAAAVVGSFFD